MISIPMKPFLVFLTIVFLTVPIVSHAKINKVYHPYVTPLEREFEWRIIHKKSLNSKIKRFQRHRYAFGASLNDRVFLEAYVVAKRLPGETFEIEAYELEGRLQLSEQGEFWADWGLLFELEREEELNSWEMAFGILSEKEWGKWSTTVNLISIYEFGSDVDNKLEFESSSQLRYRLSLAFEPAVEFYWDEKSRGIGPVIMGLQRIGSKKLKWELGLIFTSENGFDGQTIRSLVEYEF